MWQLTSHKRLSLNTRGDLLFMGAERKALLGVVSPDYQVFSSKRTESANVFITFVKLLCVVSETYI